MEDERGMCKKNSSSYLGLIFARLDGERRGGGREAKDKSQMPKQFDFGKKQKKLLPTVNGVLNSDTHAGLTMKKREKKKLSTRSASMI